jgi:Fe-S-cluster-containing hydrogenase component 2
MGVQILGFILLTVTFTLMAFPSRPLLTVGVVGLILAGAVVFSVIYEKRSFCRHLCPIGAIIGLYSTLSPIKLARTSGACCDRHSEKACAEACPMMESPQEDADTAYCNFCMKCIPACPYGNLTLRFRGFGSDLFHRAGRTASEALASLLLLGVIIIEVLSMTSLWEPLKAQVSAVTGIQSAGVVYLLLFAGVIGLPAALFYSLCWLLKRWLRADGYRVRDLATAFALTFIPLGVSLHLAHNVQHMLIEGSIAVPATMRLLQMAGLSTSVFVNFNTHPFLGIEPIYFIQMAIILAGLGLTLFILYRLLQRFMAPLPHLYKMATAMSIFILTVLLPSIYIMGVPMAGRHVH